MYVLPTTYVGAHSLREDLVQCAFVGGHDSCLRELVKSSRDNVMTYAFLHCEKSKPELSYSLTVLTTCTFDQYCSMRCVIAI